MRKYTTLWLTILMILFGTLPILVYFAMHNGLGRSDVSVLQSLNTAERLALISSLLTVKPLYMFLSAAILFVLWGRASLPTRALFWGFSALILGELICGAVFSALQRELIVSEHIHSYGMMLEYSFIAFAALDFLDKRFAPDPKRVRPLYAFAAGMGILAAFLPLSISTISTGYQADLYGFPYVYARFEFNQWVESRFLPVATLLFFALTTLSALTSNQTMRARIFLSTGIGLLAFSIIRLSLGALFAERLVWFEFWEETIQLILISTVAFLLWLYKREWIRDRAALFSIK
ncbi:MAG: hypothetical protein IT314_11935 [Anaerolineales bacterium]|nr:hypothetical protein [Anaerolineales bacterium]